MQVNLFDLAAQQARWLSVRQATVAGNIANANTTGFIPKDVVAFEKVLDQASGIKATQVGHITGGAGATGIEVRDQQLDGVVLPSGNKVQIEDELMKAGEVRRAFEMNTAIVKAFHRMIMMTSKA